MIEKLCSSDELDLCPVQLIQTHIAGPAYISGIRVLRGNDPVKLLLKKVHMPSSDAHDVPEIHGSRQSKHQAGKEDGRSRPLKLTGLPILEISGTQLGKEEHRQDQVNGGKHHVVDNRLDAVDQVLSTAPATSPVPAAKAVVAIRQVIAKTTTSITIRRL